MIGHVLGRARAARVAVVALCLTTGVMAAVGRAPARADHVEEALLEGLLQVVRADDWNANVSRALHHVEELLDPRLPARARRAFDLRFEDKVPEALAPGARVRVHGSVHGHELVVPAGGLTVIEGV